MRLMTSLVTPLVLTRLDCGNASLARLPTCQLNHLQSVLDAAGRLACGARNYDYVTPLLQKFHWLSVRDRIAFKMATLVFRCMHGLAQAYLAGNCMTVLSGNYYGALLDSHGPLARVTGAAPTWMAVIHGGSTRPQFLYEAPTDYFIAERTQIRAARHGRQAHPHAHSPRPRSGTNSPYISAIRLSTRLILILPSHK